MKKIFKKKRWVTSAIVLVNAAAIVLILLKIMNGKQFIYGYGTGMGLYFLFMAYRLPKAFRFCHHVGLLAVDYGNRHIWEIVQDRSQNPFDWFTPQRPAFEELLFSFKPLTLEAWFDEDILKKIKS